MIWESRSITYLNSGDSICAFWDDETYELYLEPVFEQMAVVGCLPDTLSFCREFGRIAVKTLEDADKYLKQHYIDFFYEGLNFTKELNAG